MAFDVPPMFIS